MGRPKFQSHRANVIIFGACSPRFSFWNLSYEKCDRNLMRFNKTQTINSFKENIRLLLNKYHKVSLIHTGRGMNKNINLFRGHLS